MKRMIPLLLLTSCTALPPEFNVDGLNYSVLSPTEQTVAVDNNRNLTVDSLNIPATIRYQGSEYRVVAIADSAFTYCGEEEPTLRKVVIAPGIQTIGKAAFAEQYHLQSVQLPEGLQLIGEDAFSNCEEMNELNWPEGLEKIEEYAFRSCRMAEFTAPSTLRTLGEYALYKKGLETVVLNAEMDSIGAYALANNIGMTALTLPEHVNYVGEGAFTITAISEVVIPATWKVVPAKAFEDCPELTRVTLNEGVEEIGARAFASCPQLTQLVLPHSIKQVDAEAFDLTSLQSITILNPNTHIEKGALTVPSLHYAQFLSCRSDHPEVVTVDKAGNLEIHGPGIAHLQVVLKDAETQQQQTVSCRVQVGE